MTAKEMFEELDYEEKNVMPYYLKYYEMVYGEKHRKTTKRIKFKNEKEIEIWKGTEFENFYTTDDSLIKLGELRAINKQVEELGWMDNEK